MSACALTGHRQIEPGFSLDLLQKYLEEMLENGVDTFYCGMAIGFDLYCAHFLLQLKERYSFRLVACIPYAGQSDRFSPQWKQIYRRCVEDADEAVVLNDTYTRQCMSERNRYMVDRADFVFAYCTQKKGGTAFTVRYARSKGKRVFFYGEFFLPLFDF